MLYFYATTILKLSGPEIQNMRRMPPAQLNITKSITALKTALLQTRTLFQKQSYAPPVKSIREADI